MNFFVRKRGGRRRREGRGRMEGDMIGRGSRWRGIRRRSIDRAGGRGRGGVRKRRDREEGSFFIDFDLNFLE